MGFLACFGCGSTSDEVREDAAHTGHAQPDASAEKARDTEKPETEKPKPADEAELARKGSVSDATPAGQPPSEAQDGAGIATADQTQSHFNEPTSPEQEFGAKHLIDDTKVQEAMHENPYPISPIAQGEPGAYEQEEWHDVGSQIDERA